MSNKYRLRVEGSELCITICFVSNSRHWKMDFDMKIG